MSPHSTAMDEPAIAPISPFREMGAYEALWLEKDASFKHISEKFASTPNALSSDFVEADVAIRTGRSAWRMLKNAGIDRFGVRINHASDYPARLRDAQCPVELLYYQGEWELSESPSVAVVGSRKASPDGLKRAARIARELVKNKITVVSGLAKGIDTAALTAALEEGGRVIGVIGTPLGSYYPPENKELQDHIADKHLLISQVPVIRYSRQKIGQNRLFFPERNATMSAMTKATIIVEAGEKSGTLIQARAAIHQGRKLFILNSCFDNTSISWPDRYEAKGAIRVRESDDIFNNIG